MSIKKAIDKTFQRWFLNSKGEISFTKIGVEIAATAGVILTLPASAATVGVTLALPPALIAGAKLATIIGGAIAGVGARDAVDKKGNEK